MPYPMAPPITTDSLERPPRDLRALRIGGWVLTVFGGIIAGLVIWVFVTAKVTGVPIVNMGTYIFRTIIFLLPLIAGLVMLVVSRRK